MDEVSREKSEIQDNIKSKLKRTMAKLRDKDVIVIEISISLDDFRVDKVTVVIRGNIQQGANHDDQRTCFNRICCLYFSYKS